MQFHPEKPLEPRPLTRASCTETGPDHEWCGFCALCNSPRWYCGHARQTKAEEKLPS